MSALSISELTFGYKKNKPILKGLNMEVPSGSIYGFLGANGAGKSTTIRTALGLLTPQSGEISLFQQKLRGANSSIFSNIGSLIESPSLYPHLHAIDHLQISRNYLRFPASKIEEVLDKVGLLEHRKKATRKYSTGMKQRLGIAMALVHDPDLLILDEPVNGLDPTGITEVRNLISQLQAEGKTIMLSSHHLSEIEKIATHVGIIKTGKMIFEGNLVELSELKSARPTVEIKTNDAEKISSILSDHSVSIMESGQIQFQIPHKDNLPDLIRKLASSGVDLYEIRLIQSDLEQMFISMTNE